MPLMHLCFRNRRAGRDATALSINLSPVAAGFAHGILDVVEMRLAHDGTIPGSPVKPCDRNGKNAEGWTAQFPIRLTAAL